MDTIRLTGVRANGTHDVLDFEHERAQPFVVDAALHLDLTAAGRSDALADTVDYGRAAKAIVAVIEGARVDLIEKLAQDIADALLAIDPIRTVDVTVHKPHAPITVPFDDVAVTITRSRDAAPAPASASSAAVGKTIPLKAVISMDSTSTDAERLFREAIVAIDGLPGNQVEGISPLYHVSGLDGPDAMSAVIQIETKMGARALIGALGAIEDAHGRALDLDLVDMERVTSDEPDCRVPWPGAKTHASVLAPWMDMDPDATLGGDPVSFLLATAPDAARVGMLSDDWIIGAQ